MTMPTTEQTTAQKTPQTEKEEARPVPDAAAAVAVPPSSPHDDERPRTKKSKKKHKSKKRCRQEEEGGDENDNDNDNGNDNDHDMDNRTAAGDAAPAKSTKEERRAARAAKKAKKADRPDVPTHDPATGAAYNKLQLRRMKRRVKHGLAPIATAEEEQELRAREKRERVEEERLYAAEEAVAAVVEETAAPEGDAAGTHASAGAGAAKTAGPDGEEGPEAAEKQERKRHNPPSKNTRRAKPVPEGYVCMACHNKSDAPPHWIYDCPQKVNKKGCNAVAKRLRGLHDPPSRKVFVGGLPFDCDDNGVKRFFEEGVRKLGNEDHDVELVHLKLLKFEDSKRCKGQAFLTFASDEVAALALRMNGAVWQEAEEEAGAKPKKKKKEHKGAAGEAGGEKKKELRLKVTRVLNRFVTKKQRGGHVMR